MTTKLKPCPFCGSTLVRVKSTHVPGMVAVGCSHCGCRGPAFDWDKEASARAWNEANEKLGERKRK